MEITYSDQVLVEQLLAAERPEVQLDQLHAFEQWLQVGPVLQLDADQGGAAFPVRLLDVLEAHDVIRRPQCVVDELAQLTGLLSKLDDEVVLAPEVDEAPL